MALRSWLGGARSEQWLRLIVVPDN